MDLNWRSNFVVDKNIYLDKDIEEKLQQCVSIIKQNISIEHIQANCQFLIKFAATQAQYSHPPTLRLIVPHFNVLCEVFSKFYDSDTLLVRF